MPLPESTAWLEAELGHVADEALDLGDKPMEPDYVPVLLQVAETHRLAEQQKNLAARPQACPLGVSAAETPKAAPIGSGKSSVREPRLQTVPLQPAQARQPAPPLETYPVLYPDEAPGCSIWRGNPDHYQEQAALAAVESGLSVMAWYWVETDCGNSLCLEAKHMILRRPQKLLYPPGMCIYCGEPSDTRDHLLPITVTGKAQRKHVLTVPACRQCNSLIGDAFAWSITERRAIAQNSLRRKNAVLLQSVDYSQEELEEFGSGLRPYLRRRQDEKRRLLRRLDFPSDETFDLRHLGHSGIEDPYAFGLLKAGEQVRHRRRR